MYYVLTNCQDIESFGIDISAFRETLVPFTFDYIVECSDAPVSGGWGCARFEFPAPTSTIFRSPNVEYRYSAESGKWQVNGVDSDISNFVEGLHLYFVTLEGAHQ